MTQALMRAVAAFRVLALGYAALLVVADHDRYARPGLGWLALAAMVVWTAITVIAATRLGRWPWTLVGSDVAVATGAVLLTVAVESRARIDAGASTLPAAWAAAPVMMAAITGGPWAGGLAAVVVSAADVVERGDITHHTFNGVILLLLTGVVGGYAVRLGQRAEAVIDAAARRDSATAERDRLAREIHDSALQVLALVARRGSEIGGESAELAVMAAEQEVALRRLVTAPLAGTGAGGEVDLRDLLTALATPRFTVSVPATPVHLPHDDALSVAAAVAEALTNVERHAGDGARAWILVETEPDEVVVTVRDDGPGIPDGRLAEAAANGRLGVAQSILGRIETIGGAALLHSADGRGTEVEIRVPR